MCENQEVNQEIKEEASINPETNSELQREDDTQENPLEELSRKLEEANTESARLSDELRKFENELNTLKERFARTLAEYDNFRKRTAKEKESIYTSACEDILKLFLPVLDNLERAASVEGDIEDIKKGIEMTIKQFKDALEKLQVEEISTENGFDPNFHNAVMHVEDESLGKNEVVEVYQKGYKRGDKVLRHSMVKVAN